MHCLSTATFGAWMDCHYHRHRLAVNYHIHYVVAFFAFQISFISPPTSLTLGAASDSTIEAFRAHFKDMSDHEDHLSSSPDKGKARAYTEDDTSASPPGYTENGDLLIALCSFEVEGLGQMSIRSGDMVRVMENNEDGWCKVRRLTDDRVGLVPRKILVSMNQVASGTIS